MTVGRDARWVAAGGRTPSFGNVALYADGPLSPPPQGGRGTQIASRRTFRSRRDTVPYEAPHQTGRPAIDTDPPPHIEDHIKARFTLSPVPTAPEIRIYKAGPRSGISRLAEREGEAFRSPYWASWWGGGIALARHVLDHPELVAGRRVLDLGAGSGLVGVAVAIAGAASVLAADVDPHAIAATRLNAAANGVAVSTRLGDLTRGEPPAVDVALVGDLFYDAALAARVTAFLDRCLGRRIEVLVGDPGRAFLPHARLRLVAEHPGPDFARAGGVNGVFAFQ